LLLLLVAAADAVTAVKIIVTKSIDKAIWLNKKPT